MNIDAETGKKIQELQILEQNLQNFLMQKQSSQMELNEIINALEFLSKSGEEVYKVIGGIMMKSDKLTLKKELEEKKKILDIRIHSAEKQEKIIEERTEKLRKEVNEAITKNKS